MSKRVTFWASAVDPALLWALDSNGGVAVRVSRDSGASWVAASAGVPAGVAQIVPGTGSAMIAYAIAPRVGLVAFVSQLDPTGSELCFSTLLGGADRDASGNSIAAAAPGEAVVGGASGASEGTRAFVAHVTGLGPAHRAQPRAISSR